MKYILLLLIASGVSCNKLFDESTGNPAATENEPVLVSKTLIEFDTFHTADTVAVQTTAEWAAEIEYPEPYQRWLSLALIDGEPTKLVIQSTESNREGRNKHALVKIYANGSDSVAATINVSLLAEPKKEIVHGGEGDDRLNSVVWTPGCAIAAGYSTSRTGDLSENRGGKDFWIIKMDDRGIRYGVVRTEEVTTTWPLQSPDRQGRRACR